MPNTKQLAHHGEEEEVLEAGVEVGQFVEVYHL